MATTASPAQRSEIKVEPVTGVLGAEVSGVDLSVPPSPGTWRELQQALDRHLVLFFRDQRLTPAQLRILVGRFGLPFLHPTAKGPFVDVPEVLELRKEPGGKLFGGEYWHSDVTWQKPGGYVSVLHGIDVPSVGNDTCFASLIAAFESLSDGLKATLRGLRAVHRFHLTVPGEREPRSAVYPVVRRHPVTGGEGFYLNSFFVKHFEGMSPEESQPLLDFLNARAVHHEFTCRFRWHRGSVAMWDNRFTLHIPINDANAERRVMIRATALEPPTP